MNVIEDSTSKMRGHNLWYFIQFSAGPRTLSCSKYTFGISSTFMLLKHCIRIHGHALQKNTWQGKCVYNS